MKNKVFIFIVALIFMLFLFSLQVQAQELNKTKITKKDAELSLKNIKTIMQELSEANFSIDRINASLEKSSQLYEAQKIIQISGKKADYSLVLAYEQEVIKLKEFAFKVRDELYTLEDSLKQLKKKEINTTEADLLIEKIRNEIKDERYEKALELIPETRKKLIETEASATTLRLFYKTTRRTIADFFRDNYISIIIFVVFCITAYFLYRKKISIYLIKRKINNLELEKKTIKELIQQLQKAYFEQGIISESDYNIRIKKYGELIRDIDRQIPLLIEKLEIVKEERKGKIKIIEDKPGKLTNLILSLIEKIKIKLINIIKLKPRKIEVIKEKEFMHKNKIRKNLEKQLEKRLMRIFEKK